MKSDRLVRAGAVLGALALVLASCGDDDDTSSAATTGAAATTAASTTAAPDTTASGAATTGGSSDTAVSATRPSFDQSENTASAPGITEDTITIGLITSSSGNAASTFVDTAEGAKARIEAENAAGGVYGRQIVLEVADDASSPQTDLVAAQSLVEQKDVFAIIGYSPYLFGSYRYLQEQGIPVVGSGFDGPEWHQEPNSNMFSHSPTDPTLEAFTTYGEFLKEVGVTKMAGMAYAQSPSSTGSIQQLKSSVEQAGLEMAYINDTVPFGGVDFTSYVLDMKSAGVDGAACSCVDSSNLAMFTALDQGGVEVKAKMAFSGPSDNFLENVTTQQASEGAFFPSTITPVILDTPATQAYVANLEEHAPSYDGGFPTFGLSGGYVSADLLIRGLWEAGQNPTRESYIEALGGVHDYDADGLLATKIDFDRAKFTEIGDEACNYFVTVKDGEWTMALDRDEPFCGTKIPGSKPG